MALAGKQTSGETMTRQKVWHTFALHLGALCLAAGCSTGPAVGTINGDVTFDGQPVKDGRIAFTPLDGQASTGGAPIVNGKFTAVVPVAKMKVVINGNKVLGKRKAYDTPESPWEDDIAELLPAKYHVNSDLTLEVKKGVQDVKYELKSK
jgi:hypothetical protein